MWYSADGTLCAVLDVRYSMFGTQCAVRDVQSVLDVRYSMCGTRRAVLDMVLDVRYSTVPRAATHPSPTPDKTRHYFRQVAVHFYDYNLRALIRGSTFARGGVGWRLRLPST